MKKKVFVFPVSSKANPLIYLTHASKQIMYSNTNSSFKQIHSHLEKLHCTSLHDLKSYIEKNLVIQSCKSWLGKVSLISQITDTYKENKHVLI